MEQLVDTSKIQLKSLIMFAMKLGYVYEGHPLYGKRFYSCLKENKHRKALSFNTMVRLYNFAPSICDWHGGYKIPFDFDFKRIEEAKSVAICSKVFLQYSKSSKKIYCQRHLLKFTSKENIVEYLGEEYV